MGNLPKFTLSKDERQGHWKLTHDPSDRVVRR
jgi:hypothetical protein